MNTTEGCRVADYPCCGASVDSHDMSKNDNQKGGICHEKNIVYAFGRYGSDAIC